MAFQPNKIRREHILRAVEKIEKQQTDMIPSTIWDVIINGKAYPPKEIMRHAHREMNGEHIWDYVGGESTNKYFKALGFEVKRKSSGVAEPASVLPEEKVAFFTSEDLQFYSKVIQTDATYRKNDPADLKKADRIKTGIFEKTNYWVKLVCDALEGFEYEEDNAWNVSGNIKKYSWARLFLKGERERKFFVTLGVSATKTALVYKFDCQREGGQKLDDHQIKVFDLFAKIGNRSWNGIEASNLNEYHWNTLTDEVVNFVKANLAAFKNIHGMTTKKPDSQDGLNTILYGPPGTGKTFNTINRAVSIANPKFDLTSKSRMEIKAEYDRLFKAGRINFVTFHQSLSYEDFIEGIKPQTLDGQVVYEVEDGVFKAFCNKARFINGNFDDVIEKFKKDISAVDGKTPLQIKAQGTTFDIIYRGTNVFYVQPLNTVKQNPWYPVNIENIRKAFETDSFDKIYNPTYVREVINHLKKNYGLVKGGAKTTFSKENYVFIIDEINRGNVSQIFGELITLIERDKREDSPETLQIQLPYSKEAFSVPDNVYILGTMNTADRSVEALDTALRRRFNFEFMPPDSSVMVHDGIEQTVSGISLKKLIDTLNERITYLLDEDHQIGHSYFCTISDENVDQLRQVIRNKIIPLLREYFYNDHAKIRLVLGDGFVERHDKKPAFAETDEDDLIVEKSSYRIKEIDEQFDIIDALKRTITLRG